jgi:Tol biopolymer transport system component
MSWTPQVGSGQARLFTIGIDGTGYRELVSAIKVAGVYSDSAKFTPDGLSILYVTTENDRSRVMRIPTMGGVPEFDGLESQVIYSIDVSPDGSWIAFSGRTPRTLELWAIDNVSTMLGGR